MRRSLFVVAVSLVALGAVFALTAPAGTQRTPAKAPTGIHKIKHVIVIMQENRSFDHYFGT
ncbi:MAG TPA: alkaline phosphatase family protein, partial [Gaiellaceae bacterium]|nr:alkaline phosphatase family protein [Gaiellaceae bacterium]